MTIIKTEAQFKSACKSLVTSGLRLEVKINSMLTFAAGHFNTTGNTVHLTALVDACSGSKVIAARHVKNFIIEHSENLAYAKNTDGNPVFKKAEKGKKAAVTLPKPCSIFDWKRVAIEPTTIDAVKMLEGTVTRLENAKENGKVKASQKVLVDEATAILEKLLANVA